MTKATDLTPQMPMATEIKVKTWVGILDFINDIMNYDNLAE